MTDFLKMDIFFAVTTAVVFFAGLFLLVGLYYGVQILRSVNRVAKNVADESDQVRGDVAILRAKVRDEGMRIKHLADFFLGIKARRAARKKKSAKEKSESEKNEA